MGSKVYFLVETDESTADPLSRMMSQLIDNMKPHEKSCPGNLPPENKGAIFSILPPRPSTPERPPIHHVSKPKFQFKEIKPGECFSSNIGKICSETTSSPKCHGLKSAIVAEATVDNTGEAKAKISVNSDRLKKDTSSCQQLYRVDSSPTNTYSFCERRNGLEPTLAELKGAKKIFYLPIKANKFGHKTKARCVNGPSILYDNNSATSLTSRFSNYYANRQSPIVAEMKKCARNIPEARIIKYNACISRRDGMQDRCDPITRKALKKCCRY